MADSRKCIDRGPRQDCMHCDTPFRESYLRWHAARALRRDDRMAMLTCKHCFCWTPVKFTAEKVAEAV